MPYYKIRPKGGTAAQWQQANTILGEREIGFEYPAGGLGKGLVKMKMGDGTTPWNDLPYAVVGEAGADVIVTLTAAGWSSSAPYSQTVSVPGLRATDAILMGKASDKSTPADTVKTWDKMQGLISAAEAQDGQAVFYCPAKKPTADFKVKLRGVSG